jgi:hypothetical protein
VYGGWAWAWVGGEMYQAVGEGTVVGGVQVLAGVHAQVYVRVAVRARLTGAASSRW